MVTHLLHIDWDRGFLQGSVANRNLGAGVVLVGLSVSVLCGLQTEDFDESTAPARTRRPSATTAPALSEACASLRKPGWSDKRLSSGRSRGTPPPVIRGWFLRSVPWRIRGNK